MKRLLLIFLLTGPAFAGFVFSQTSTPQQKAREAVTTFFANYSRPGYRPSTPMKADSVRIDENGRTLTVFVNEAFASQPFTPQSVATLRRTLSQALPTPYNVYRLSVKDKGGREMDELIPNALREDETDRSRLWGRHAYTGNPWVSNLSRPYKITQGLQGKHLMVNASHGRVYREGTWRWQRPYLFCTTEDLFTRSFVFPYLIPMLENAGAVVVTARERDPQTAEAVVDNDAPGRGGTYSEINQADFAWQTTPDSVGFAPVGLLADSVMPFRLGTSRQVATSSRRSRLASVSWTPALPRAGRYAVYVSYVSRPNSVSDARYTVYHRGGRTQFRVNQQMGGGTWVYLGTFDFEAGETMEGRVVLTNQSDYRGVVTADGVRFGGGVGQTPRGDMGTTGLPRQLEAARYHAQWSGLPDSLYNKDKGQNDYNDDIRSRGYMLNYLGGGSSYMPGLPGLGVPLEAALALHSDAGVTADQSVYGSLAICTTVDGLGQTAFPTGVSRRASADLATLILSNVVDDMSRTFRTNWTRREMWDRNYGETRIPDVPSAIFEMLSHQNYTDMTYGHDPHFKFALSRALYKALLHFVCYQHGEKDYEVQPLPVEAFAARLTPEGEVCLSWRAVADTLCDNARPTGYVVYTRVGDEGFDNGRYVSGQDCSLKLPVSAGLVYSFKVTAVNRGGESFPSEVLSVYRSAQASAPTVLIVNGFERLSGPARVEGPDSLGFNLDADIGVARDYTMAFAGRQTNFARSAMGLEGPGGLGYCGHELVGVKVMGNTMDFPVTHGNAIAASGRFSYVSCSRKAFVEGQIPLSDYPVIDLICGLQRHAPQDFKTYKIFDAPMRRRLTDYLASDGALMVSGSFLGTDLETQEERDFARQVLRYLPAGTARQDSTDYVRGLNIALPIQRAVGGERYAVQAPDAIVPADSSAFTAFAYGGGQSAGIASSRRGARVIAMGFPFESITDAYVREQAMQAILTFLTASPTTDK